MEGFALTHLICLDIIKTLANRSFGCKRFVYLINQKPSGFP